MSKDIIIGYGNPDRQDDGVAWHVLNGINQRLGRESPLTTDDEFPPAPDSPELIFQLQLTPELSETISKYDRVCFVDAHTGNVPNDIYQEDVQSDFQSSPFTHHLTPSTCMALVQTLYQKKPAAILVSVRGFEFGFHHTLTDRTATLASRAVELIWQWLNFPK
jgi:hydrogenase maturation protease